MQLTLSLTLVVSFIVFVCNYYCVTSFSLECIPYGLGTNEPLNLSLLSARCGPAICRGKKKSFIDVPPSTYLQSVVCSKKNLSQTPCVAGFQSSCLYERNLARQLLLSLTQWATKLWASGLAPHENFVQSPTFIPLIEYPNFVYQNWTAAWAWAPYIRVILWWYDIADVAKVGALYIITGAKPQVY